MTLAIKILPDKTVEDVEVNSLEDGQAIVGGFIEAVSLKDGSTLWVNEEYIYAFDNSEFNSIATDVAGLGGRIDIMLSNPIKGAAYITGPPDDEGETTDVTKTAKSWVTRVSREAGGTPYTPLTVHGGSAA